MRTSKESAMKAENARWVRIRLQLARTPEFPDGSAMHGYNLVAPLDKDDHIDVAAWRSNRQACTVTRHWGNEAPQNGFLVHRAGGSDGATWWFDYDTFSDEDDEAGYRLGDHAFREGDYISVKEHGGSMHPFRIVAVEEA
jgi:hypothetical protein